MKCGSDFWPCVIYSSSFAGAKIIANVKSGLPEKLKSANNFASLRYCFKRPEKLNPVIFFVTGRVIKIASYNGSQDMSMLTLQFSQRPPDDLIEILGRLLDANVNSTKRQEERINMTVETQRKLGILANESEVLIQSVPRRCIMKDISFSGAKVIMVGIEKFLVDKEIALKVGFEDPDEQFTIKGKFVRFEKVEGKKELIALAMHFDENFIPMGYKIRINEYLSTVRAEDRGNPPAVSCQRHDVPSPAPVNKSVSQRSSSIIADYYNKGNSPLSSSEFDLPEP